MNTNSQIRDYSLEDGGGIFEKKTIVANDSIEEAKLMGDSLTQRSYEPIHVDKSQS